MDLDLRLVRYFTVVAEHLSFSRAAAALRLAQPSLSRQIRRLEHQLGARLLDRTPRGSVLTPAGRSFLPEAKALLAAAERARLAVRPTLTIGYPTGLVVTPAVHELRRRHPTADIRTRHLTTDAAVALTHHEVDAVITRSPLPGPGLHLTHLYDEPRVLLVPRTHRLAARASVSVRDLTGEPVLACPATTMLGSTPLPPATTLDDKAESIADGHRLAVLPAGDRRSLLRTDLTRIPLTDIDPCHVTAATRSTDPNRLTTAFHEVAVLTLR